MVLDLNVESPADSGTSSSSVLNSADAGGFRFGLLGSPDDDDCSGGLAPAAASGFVTRQLFPASPLGPGVMMGQAPAPPPTAPVWQPRRVEELVVAQRVAPAKKTRRGPRSRSSQYRGVTFYRRTGRWESHIWDCGKQVYLGGFDTAHAAARAYDRAAIKFRGLEADINFNLSDYEEDLKQMRNWTKEEFVHILRRQSTGFARGSSKYRGVTLHKCGRWEARMGQLLGKKVQVQERPMEPRPPEPSSFPGWGWHAQAVPPGSSHSPLLYAAASSGFSTAAGANPAPPLPPSYPDHHRFYFPRPPDN